MNLLRYAYGLRQLDLHEPVGYSPHKGSFQDLLVQQLAAEVGELLARGIHRDYKRASAELASPRGRIDFDRYVSGNRGTSASLPCITYPRVEDTPLNRVLLGGLLFSARVATDIDLRARVQQLAKILSTTVSVKHLGHDTIEAARRIMDRRTAAYAASLVLIELLFGAQGVALDVEDDEIHLAGFLFDMNRFFQSLLSRFFHQYLVDCASLKTSSE